MWTCGKGEGLAEETWVARFSDAAPPSPEGHEPSRLLKASSIIFHLLSGHREARDSSQVTQLRTPGGPDSQAFPEESSLSRDT